MRLNQRQIHESSSKKSYWYRLGQIFLGLLVLLLVMVIGFAVGNQFGSDFSDLSKTDQKVVQEVEDYYKAYKNKEVWSGYTLKHKSFLLVDGRGKAYLFNPQKPIHSFFAKKIRLPKGSPVSVYRLSAWSPSLLKVYGIGNFNTLGQTVRVAGSSVFYLRYNAKDNVNTMDQDAHHVITFLSHEDFHGQQISWGQEDKGGRFDTGSLTAADKQTLAERYAALQALQTASFAKEPNLDDIRERAKAYVAISNKLKAENPAYFKDETLAETYEGTATYVSAKAADAAGYPFTVTGQVGKEGPIPNPDFTTIMPAIEQGTASISVIPQKCIYASGGLLCRVLDQLTGNTNWQDKLNHQDKDHPVTLFDLLEETVND